MAGLKNKSKTEDQKLIKAESMASFKIMYQKNREFKSRSYNKKQKLK